MQILLQKMAYIHSLPAGNKTCSLTIIHLMGQPFSLLEMATSVSNGTKVSLKRISALMF